MKKTKLLFLLFTFAGSLSAQTVFYVKQSTGGAEWNGRQNVYTNIQEAIDAAAAQAGETNAQVWIAKGTYTINGQSLAPKSGVDVIGGFVGTETAKGQCAPVGKGVNQTILKGGVNESSATLRVINQTAALTKPAYWSNLAITGGRPLDGAKEGAGAMLNSGMTLKNSIIYGNVGARGAGAYLKGDAQLINCLVNYNTGGPSPDEPGIGVCASGNSKVINCTVTVNKFQATYGGGNVKTAGIYAKDNALVANSISWNNISVPNLDLALQIYKQEDSNVVIANCASNYQKDSEGNTITYGGNIIVLNVSDPLFVNPGEAEAAPTGNAAGWDLEEYSPCIDAGNNDLISEKGDLNGDWRFRIGDEENKPAKVDIGALEFDGGYDDVSVDNIPAKIDPFYPNPCKGTLYSGIDGEYTVKVMSVSGAMVYEAVAAASIDFSFLPKGYYLLQWQAGDSQGCMPLILE